MWRMKDIATALLNALTENDVDRILENDFFKSGKWFALGGGRIGNNYGLVHAQQSDPVASLAEKITNSRDAILIKKCKEFGIEDLRSDAAPHSMLDALIKFFGGPDQIERDWNKLVKEGLIKIIADGPTSTQGEPNLIIIDRGCGQSPEDFPRTFLSLLAEESEKRGVKFLQGRFDMGGAGVLPYCGEKGYELIISRSATKGGNWGWTIVRENRQKVRYEYFAVGVQLDGTPIVPSFDAKKYNGIEDGSIIKLYSYDIPRKSHISSGLRYYLDMFMYNSYLPVVLEDHRKLGSKIDTLPTAGMGDRLLRHDDTRELLATDYPMPIVVEANFGKFGKKLLEVFVLKRNSELSEKQKRRKQLLLIDKKPAIFFTINGQTHATMSRSFIRTRCQKPELEDDIIVNIDCTDITGADHTDIFMSNREHMKKNKVTKVIELAIAKALKEDERLNAMENERFNRTELPGDDKHTSLENTLIAEMQPIIESVIAQLKLRRDEIYNPVRVARSSRPAEPKYVPKYNPPFFPTVFKIAGCNKPGLWKKNMPINSTGTKIVFELNAPDNYFHREQYPGTLTVTPDMTADYGTTLISGALTIRIVPKEGAKVGEIHKVKVAVSRYEDTDLEAEFEVEYIAPSQPNPEPKPKKETEKEKENTPPNVADLGLPPYKKVYKDMWGDYEPAMTAEDAVRIKEKAETGKMIPVFHINMHSNGLQEYLRAHYMDYENRETTSELYFWAVFFYSLSMYTELKAKIREDEESEGAVNVRDLVQITMKGMSRLMLPLQIPPATLKKIHTGVALAHE